MKAVILAGGLGTRISEESTSKPKPMIDIGGMPILWHILKCYSHFGINDFIICCGYKGYLIKEYFANYFLHMSDVSFDMTSNKMEVHHQHAEPWRITLIDTGEHTMTGGRLNRIKEYVAHDPAFCVTYGDGLSNINFDQLINHHNKSKAIVTLTAVHPPARFGSLELDGGNVSGFKEKPKGDGARINGGFFVMSPEVFNYFKNDNTVLEKEPLESLASERKLNAFKHDGFWYAMDTLRDKNILEDLWSSGKAPWKVWK
ncbi:glucose-1-phosphate cytidylyltransferase [beta proteobacterium KB13]|uniref:Glucose-1-phosphate cytidylyltransferase n=1 Tax=beta proteobacterium KB13 TaxID=314607 RepID=B6BTH4_9PROT|nr:glucose-1-phosphate cytidylyltransferase [beta proteobacterium KB13]